VSEVSEVSEPEVSESAEAESTASEVPSASEVSGELLVEAEPTEPTELTEPTEPTVVPIAVPIAVPIEVPIEVTDESELPTAEEVVVEVFAGGGAAIALDTERAMALPAPHRRRSQLPWWIFAAVVLALVVVAVVLVLTSDAGSDTPVGVDGAGAEIALVIGMAEPTDTEATDIDCPVDLTTVVARLPVLDTARELTGAGEYSAVLAPRGAPVALVECSFEGDDGELVGISLGVLSEADGFESTMKSFLSRHRITFDEPREWRGGTIVAYCGEPTAAAADAGFDPFCEVDWVHPDLVVGVFASPDVLTAEQVGEWLESTLDMIVQQLAAG
jgi:hypothetical protein